MPASHAALIARLERLCAELDVVRKKAQEICALATEEVARANPRADRLIPATTRARQKRKKARR